MATTSAAAYQRAETGIQADPDVCLTDPPVQTPLTSPKALRRLGV